LSRKLLSRVSNFFSTCERVPLHVFQIRNVRLENRVARYLPQCHKIYQIKTNYVY
jgi:hypothetical protein